MAADAGPRTAVITGAAGFVGVNLIRRLASTGWQLRTADLNPLVGVDTTGIEHTIADVRDTDAIRKVAQGADVVFHLAARITLASDDPEAWDINTAGPASVAAATLDAGVPRMVHCSSVHAFDLSLAVPRLNEMSPRALAPHRPVYDRSKYAGEMEVRKVIDQGLDATIVNPTGVVGPIDLGPSRMNQVIDSAARGHLPVVVRGGFDWVDVRDVCEGLLAALDKGRTGENYLLGGHHASALHLGRLAAAFNGRLGPVVALPAWLARLAAPTGEKVSARFGSDVFTPASIGTLLDDPIVEHDKAAAELGYEPRPLEDTVREVVRWFEGEARL